MLTANLYNTFPLAQFTDAYKERYGTNPIDCEIPAHLAKIANDSGVGYASLVTSVGANPNSWFLYTHT